MRKSALYFFILLLNFFITNGIAQNLHKVSKPNLELRDDKLIILYSIQHFNSEDKFKVWIEITDGEGNTIDAVSLTGDIGENISGGINKEITWDFKKDNFDTDTEIFVEVSAERIFPPPIVTKDTVQDKTTREEVFAEKSIQREEISSGKMLIYSVLFPGLGFVKTDKSKLHLVKGAAGYTFILSSIIYNRVAISNYDKYLVSYEIENSDNYFKKSVRQDNVSEAFAYAAIGIWAAEIVWILMESKNHNSHVAAYGKKIFIEPRFDSNSKTSLICLSYNF